MCRLNLVPAGQAAAQGQRSFAEFSEEDAALEALLSLSGVGAASESGDTTQADPAGASSERYYCPFPSCKRSFAELWRLKVHYRAPPNIRGSGKERGHGMRLTHCPKCGAALKVGGHHVKCAAVSKEPGGSAASTGRRNRKAAAASRSNEFVTAATPAGATAAAQVYADPAPHHPGAQQQQQQQQLAFTGAAAAAAAGSDRLSAYAQYGLSGMLPHEQGETQMLAQRAAAFLQQQQQQLMAEDYTEDCTSAGAAHPATASKPMLGSAAAVAVGVSLQRLASSDDSSNSRIIEASSSGGAGCGSGYDNSWGPSISSGSGSGSDERGYQQQQQHVQQLHQPPEPCAAYPAAAAAAASQLPPAVKLERTEQQPQDQQLQQQHPQAGQLLWQHMLLQHLQQHVQQAPGFSLPELISVAAALFGNKVDTLVSAFGLPGAAAGDSCSNSSSVHAQMAELVSSLKQADTAQAPAAADGGAAPVYLPRQ